MGRFNLIVAVSARFYIYVQYQSDKAVLLKNTRFSPPSFNLGNNEAPVLVQLANTSSSLCRVR